MAYSPNIFFTGFPGFIAKRLVDRLVSRNPDAHFTFLIQSHLRDKAEQAVLAIAEKHAGFGDRVELVAGDLTLPQLGLAADTYKQVIGRTEQVWHLAAVYDLAVDEKIAYRVNVTGTETVLNLCEACDQLKRFNYVSTCYVSGTRTGRVLEDELDEGQEFKNHYESTKFGAEREVRNRMQSIPTTIYRPAIVVGDSQTGRTDKYDGPYFVIRLLMRLPSWLPTLNLGKGDAIVNMVPVDFLVDAMAALADNAEAIGRTVHLADSSAYTAREVVAAILGVLGRAKPVANVPSTMVERLLRLGWVRRIMQVPEQAVTYFNHPVEYDTANQRSLLQGSGVQCPDFLSILPTLIDYVRAHPEKDFLDGRRL